MPLRSISQQKQQQDNGVKEGLFTFQVQIEAHLKHHRNYVPTNGVFDCKVCTDTFTRKEHLDRHTLLNHTVSGSALTGVVS